MCGIIGYVGRKAASPILLEGLRRLEYRGYDSAGVAMLDDGSLHVRKKMGKISEGIARLLKSEPVAGTLGIGHTRWATHGPPSDANSHPHLDQSGRIAVVHNGVIENYDALRQKLLAAGHKFKSGTDTEVLAHLIGDYYGKRKAGRVTPRAPDSSNVGAHEVTRPANDDLTQAVCDALREVIGTYGLAVISADQPDTIVGARRGSPLIIGIGAGENFLASDANAFVGAAHTKKVVYLNDYDVATVTPERFDVLNLGTDTATVQISNLESSQEDAVRGKYEHFMLKEIFEQPRTVENALRGRVDKEGATAKFGGLNLTAAELRAIDRIVIAASGTSWHAALVGEYLIEELAQIPVEVEFAHEFCYRNCPLEKNTVLLVLSQSGETADTLAALREAKRRGHKALAIVNVVGIDFYLAPFRGQPQARHRVRFFASHTFDLSGGMEDSTDGDLSCLESLSHCNGFGERGPEKSKSANSGRDTQTATGHACHRPSAEFRPPVAAVTFSMRVATKPRAVDCAAIFSGAASSSCLWRSWASIS